MAINYYKFEMRNDTFVIYYFKILYITRDDNVDVILVNNFQYL